MAIVCSTCFFLCISLVVVDFSSFLFVLQSSQEPWIQNATFRDNITFGAPFNQTKYNAVLQACALTADIAALPGGDLTEIGERGINLSGGQKARVTLGRACYADTDVVVLDDILSAVDAHVARTITDKCLVELLRGQGKTVILATHQTLCFPDADTIIVVKEGAIAFQGDFRAAKQVKEFAEILGSMDEHPAGNADSTNANSIETAVSTTNVMVDAATKDESEPSTVEQRKPSIDSSNAVLAADSHDGQDKGKLTKEEKTEEGAVTLGVYLQYASMVGRPMCFFVLLLIICVNGNQVAVNWWLSRWSVSSNTLATEENPRDTNYYLIVYLILGLCACVLIFAYQIAAAFGGLFAAAGIHNNMFKAILLAPMSFFDTTPSGQILNRFTADMKCIDEQLISQLSGGKQLFGCHMTCTPFEKTLTFVCFFFLLHHSTIVSFFFFLSC